jgi:hypothetical protein
MCVLVSLSAAGCLHTGTSSSAGWVCCAIASASDAPSRPRTAPAAPCPQGAKRSARSCHRSRASTGTSQAPQAPHGLSRRRRPRQSRGSPTQGQVRGGRPGLAAADLHDRVAVRPHHQHFRRHESVEAWPSSRIVVTMIDAVIHAAARVCAAATAGDYDDSRDMHSGPAWTLRPKPPPAEPPLSPGPGHYDDAKPFPRPLGKVCEGAGPASRSSSRHLHASLRLQAALRAHAINVCTYVCVGGEGHAPACCAVSRS